MLTVYAEYHLYHEKNTYALFFMQVQSKCVACFCIYSKKTISLIQNQFLLSNNGINVSLSILDIIVKHSFSFIVHQMSLINVLHLYILFIIVDHVLQHQYNYLLLDIFVNSLGIVLTLFHARGAVHQLTCIIVIAILIKKLQLE